MADPKVFRKIKVMEMNEASTFVMMFSVKDLIIAGAILAVIILAGVIGLVLSSGKKKKEIELAHEEADFYCDLYYLRQMKEAEAKYKAYVSRGYHNKLPNQVEAIGRDKQLQDLLDQTDALTDRKKSLRNIYPILCLLL